MLYFRRQWANEIDPWHGDNLGNLLQAKFGFAVGDSRAHDNCLAAFGANETHFRFELRGQPEPYEQVRQIEPAGGAEGRIGASN